MVFRLGAAVVVSSRRLWALPLGRPRSLLTPVLGRTWAPDQKGYGQSHPTTVFNRGDPTGLVRRIRWQNWGNSIAIGEGVSTYVWPGTSLGDNPPRSGARIVAFHFGTC